MRVEELEELRFKAAWLDHGAGTGRRRRRLGILEGPRRGLAGHARQRCWVHKTANVLNKLPKSQQPKAKRALQDIWMAETRNDAEASFDAFIETYELKYEKAADCLRNKQSWEALAREGGSPA